MSDSRKATGHAKSDTPAARTKSDPRNVDDVPYAELAGDRPMREVLADRKRQAAKLTRALREKAFRTRAGMIGLLQSCLCGYPLLEADTISKHEEWCPSHMLHLSYERIERGE